MRDYAQRIGARYRLDLSQNYMGHYSKYFDLLRPVHDKDFWAYDRVLFVDLDVFAVEGLTDNIFEEPVADIGMCEEPGQPDYREGRKKHINGEADKTWATFIRDRWEITVPVDSKQRVRVFNSGVVMYTREGMAKANRVFLSVDSYVKTMRECRVSRFYSIDQNYMHAMAHLPEVTFTEMSPEWNRQVHGKDDGSIYDERNADTKFVHVQLSSADHWDSVTHHRIVNRPQAEWCLP
jgi:hypothetical protein